MTQETRARRNARGHVEREPSVSMITRSLPFKPPYDWPAMIGFLGARAARGVEAVQGGSYARSVAVGSAAGTITVRPDARRSALVAVIRFPEVTALPAIVARIRRLLDLDADPAVIGAHLALDPAMAPLVAARPGLRVPGAWDGFELAMRAVLGQQISVAAATLLAGKLVVACSTKLPGAAPVAEGGLTHLFPHPARIANAPDLGARIGLPRRRAATIVALARAAADDPRLFEPGRGLEETVQRLCALPGVGEWTAHYIAMRAMREPDAFPAADVGLLRAMATEAGRPTPAQLLARAAAWRPWRAYAALHLWASGPAAAQQRQGDAA